MERTTLSSRETRILLRRARDSRYWQELNPEHTSLRHARIDDRVYNDAVEQMNEDGYFHVDGVYSLSSMRRMRTSIERVRQAGWPAVFSMIYEDFWTIVRTPPVVRLLAGILGPGYMQIPHMWCHYVNPSLGAHGWLPHVDGSDKTRVSIWIPFTDATLDNGCIYLVPESRLPRGFGRNLPRRIRYSNFDTLTLLQNMRALPAPAGSILGWNFGVIHWGSMAVDGPEPRVSASYEFIARGVKPESQELPLMDIRAGIPSFEERLQLIGRALKSYAKFEPRMARYRELGEDLHADH